MQIAIVGMGEVGNAIKSLILQSNLKHEIIEIDKDLQPTVDKKINIVHICFPMISQEEFVREVNRYIKTYNPNLVIIESTVLPGTCKKIAQHNPTRLLIHSPIRGQHSRLSEDMKHYTKWISSSSQEAINLADEYYCSLGLSTKTLPSFEITEISKLLDTSQYGILIAWAQESERMCKQFNVDYDYVREFGRETQKFYNVRPDIRPGFVGGKCIRQNIALLKKLFKSKFFEAFIESNKLKASETGTRDDVDYG